MKLSKILRNGFLAVLAGLVLTACATKNVKNQTQGDVYTGKETIKYLASGVKDLGNEFEVNTFALHKSANTIKSVKNIYNK